MDYPHELAPFSHQRDEFEAHRDTPSRGLWWEMGTGKTKPTLDTIAWLAMHGKIRGAIILAPKAVAPNWARTEIPRHLPELLRQHTKVVLWDSSKARGTKGYQKQLAEAMDYTGLVILCMSYDGIMQGEPGRRFRKAGLQRAWLGCHFARELMDTRPTMMVLDESARIKNPKAKRTKRVLAAGRYAPYRRVLSGTPVTNSPFDCYTQVRFLDPDFWGKFGCGGFEAFKTQFGEWVKRLQNPRACPHPESMRPNCGCPTFPFLIRYRNLNNLHDAMAKVGSRLRKDEVLDLPPKLYTEVPFDLTPPLWRVYQELRDEFMVMLDDGDMISAPLVITKLLRLQQLTSGYCPTDDGDELLAAPNPRLDTLADLLEDIPHQFIVWAKFQRDFDQISAKLDDLGLSYVTYTGKTSTADRETARDRFQDGDARVFLGNPAAAGEGLTLTAARTVVYYNTSYRLADRLQSEDRAHRIGQAHPVQYFDLVARDTVDEKVIDALRAKKDIADMILGDPRQKWL